MKKETKEVKAEEKKDINEILNEKDLSTILNVCDLAKSAVLNNDQELSNLLLFKHYIAGKIRKIIDESN